MLKRRAIIISFLLIAIITSPALIAQTSTIDRLKQSIRASSDDNQRLRAMIRFCEQGYSLHPDTLLLYSRLARSLAITQNQPVLEADAMHYEAFALTNKGLIDSSLQLADQCLKFIKNHKIEDEILEGNVFNQKGRCYMRKNQYKEAVGMGYAVIGNAERGNDILLQMKGKTLIGWAYLEMGQTKESLNWHLRALRTTRDTSIIQQYGILFANIALNYNALGKPDSALHYIDRAIRYSRKHENLFALSNSLAIQAQLFVTSGKSSMAEAPLKEMVEIRKLIGDPFYTVSDMAQLGLYYANNGQPDKGIGICKEGIAIARKYGLKTKLSFLYASLADCYRAKGDMATYAQTLEQIVALKDSVYQTNSAESLAEMQAKYDLERKENVIIRQKLDINRKNFLFYGLLLVSVFAAVVGWLIFQDYRRKHKLRLQQIKEEERINAALAIIRAEEAERKRIAADLHDNLGAYAASIVSNLDHLTIQQTEPNKAVALQELRNNSQSIVSQLNDTIWALKKDSLSLTAISDRLKIFIQRIQSSYPDIKIDVYENIRVDHMLPPSQAFHLFQVLQEAINNAVRHSGGSQVNVEIESDKSWSIAVTDDGKGMNRSDFNAEGNGLVNMRNRSKEAGWNINWQPNEQKGTRLVINPSASNQVLATTN